MLLSRWLFPGAEGNPHAENTVLFPSFFSRAPVISTTTPAGKGQESGVRLLEEYDASAADEHLNEAIKHVPLEAILALKKKQLRANSPLFSGTPTRRAFAWLVLLGYLTLIYVGIFYFFYFLADNATTLVDVLKTTASNTHTGLADAYQNLVDPATPQQVADLMTEFYELLAKMGYYDASIIARPPHISPSINKTLAAELNYSKAAIDMMEMLPYLNINGNMSVFNWEAGSYGNEFLLRGVFADMRNDEDLETSRDPYFMGSDSEESGYMLPDYVSLSLGPEEGSMMVVNVQNMKMWTFQMEGNADPATQHIANKEDTANWLSPEQYPSRLARDALRDYINKFITLEWMPGALYNGSWDGDEHARLYLKNGWRGNFDSAAFYRDRIQWHIDDEARFQAEEPFENVVNLARNVDSLLSGIMRKQEEIKAIDAGTYEGQQYPDMLKHRADLVQSAAEESTYLPQVQAKLEKAREALKSVDPAVKKAREERIAKYGF